MTNKRVRKKPLTTVTSKQSLTHKATQSTISSFHTLLKQQASIKRQLVRASEDQAEHLGQQLQDIEDKLKALGGLESYQVASQHGQSTERGGDSAKVLISWLQELGHHTRERRLRLLEIGALTPNNYAKSKWIRNTPIDLHSQHPDILEQDFFERPLPTAGEEEFDVISCSLVLNFVPDPKERGRMLQLIHRQLRPSTSSLLFLVLPLPCVQNSRYLSPESLRGLMRSVGFEMVNERWKEGGKVGYWLLAWRPPSNEGADKWKRKTLGQDGPKRNNFAIVLP